MWDAWWLDVFCRDRKYIDLSHLKGTRLNVCVCAHICMCVCMYACTAVRGCAHGRTCGGWRAMLEVFLCKDPSFIVGDRVSHWSRSSWFQLALEAKEIPNSACLHPLVLGSQVHIVMVAFLWVLGIQTHVLLLVQQVLLPTEPPPKTPRTRISSDTE